MSKSDMSQGNLHRKRVNTEVSLVLFTEKCAAYWRLIRVGLYVFAIFALVHYLRFEPSAKGSLAGIAAIITIPWLAWRIVRLLQLIWQYL